MAYYLRPQESQNKTEEDPGPQYVAPEEATRLWVQQFGTPCSNQIQQTREFRNFFRNVTGVNKPWSR
jgi:hypothetical protein